MSTKVSVKGYHDSLDSPWGKLFYKMIWHNLEFEGKRVLDFGSGFGITANHLAKDNDVVAVEPSEDMLSYRMIENKYTQMVGGIEQLKTMEDKSFDVIICHNVLEYVTDRDELFREFKRLLKTDGFISVVKHNRNGKIMQRAVFDYNVDEALDLIHNEVAVSPYFGTIDEYENAELEKYANNAFEIEKVYGVRIFFGIQKNEFKTDENWLENMYKLECEAESVSEFRNIAFSHHVILKLKNNLDK